VVFGWVFASHMIGAGISAWVAGAIREATGSYDPAWWISGGLCLVAAVACLLVPRGNALGVTSDELEPMLAPH
jgi:cyanate permease